MNAKHQFKYTYNGSCKDFSPIDISFDVPGDVTLSQILYNFQSYLKAVGFVFDGELEIVDHTFDVMDEVDGTLYEIDKQEEFEKQWNKACGCEGASSPLEKFNEDLSKLEKEVKKNNWVHGICNPPADDAKKYRSASELPGWGKHDGDFMNTL
jgi:hypothetical protein